MHEYLIIKKEVCEICDGKETPYGYADTCKSCDGRGYTTDFVSLAEALDELVRNPSTFAPKKHKGKK